MDDIYIYLIDLPTKVHEMVTPCLGGYTVYINSRLSDEGRLEAMDHAMWHIKNNDFEKEDVVGIEDNAWRRHEESRTIYEGQQ